MYLAKASKVVYYCYYCRDQVFDKQDCVQNHWTSLHQYNDLQPFRFYACEVVTCYQCNHTGSWNNVIDHHTEVHPNEVFAAVSGNNRKSCSLCNYKGLMNIHFKKKHREIPSGFSINRMLPNNLQNLLQINDANTKRDRKYDFLCCSERITHEYLLEHLQQHENICSICKSFKTTDIVGFLFHVREEHGDKNADAYLSTFQQKLKMLFENIEMVYENGLILSHSNLAGTIYDLTSEYNASVKAWLEWIKEEFEAEKEKKYTLKIGIPHLVGEDVNILLGNLYGMLRIIRPEILKIMRIDSKTISVEFLFARDKDRIMKFVQRMPFATFDLYGSASSYTLPPNMNFSVTFQ